MNKSNKTIKTDRVKAFMWAPRSYTPFASPVSFFYFKEKKNEVV